MKILLTKKGQTTVEYILLLAVVVLISLSLIRSQFFLKFIGPDSEIFEKVRLSIQYSYRHALPGYGETPSNVNALYGSGNHDSYGIGNNSRFYRTKIYP